MTSISGWTDTPEVRCGLTDRRTDRQTGRHTDKPNYRNPRCACAPRVKNHTVHSWVHGEGSCMLPKSKQIHTCTCYPNAAFRVPLRHARSCLLCFLSNPYIFSILLISALFYVLCSIFRSRLPVCNVKWNFAPPKKWLLVLVYRWHGHQLRACRLGYAAALALMCKHSYMMYNRLCRRQFPNTRLALLWRSLSILTLPLCVLAV